jgi:hypothetical protein
MSLPQPPHFPPSISKTTTKILSSLNTTTHYGGDQEPKAVQGARKGALVHVLRHGGGRGAVDGDEDLPEFDGEIQSGREPSDSQTEDGGGGM